MSDEIKDVSVNVEIGKPTLTVMPGPGQVKVEGNDVQANDQAGVGNPPADQKPPDAAEEKPQDEPNKDQET